MSIRPLVSDWVFMWILAFALFLACKWLTWRRRAVSRSGALRSLAYLAFWPGMDAEAFLHGAAKATPSRRAVAGTLTRVLAGAALLALASSTTAASPLAAGWTGMAGTVLLLHFGLFALLSHLYRAAGVEARPLMDSPLVAGSLTGFWNRWNTGFNTLAQDFLFRPLARRVGSPASTLAVFAVSGLVHDLVISLPARGGFGWPTAYFLLQGAGVLFERGGIGRRLGLRKGWRGRLFMMAVTLAPLPWLFHFPFRNNIILPMLNGIGETWRGL
jgi:alginate O-acetyltransferase complex protein AlgI